MIASGAPLIQLKSFTDATADEDDIDGRYCIAAVVLLLKLVSVVKV